MTFKDALLDAHAIVFTDFRHAIETAMIGNVIGNQEVHITEDGKI